MIRRWIEHWEWWDTAMVAFVVADVALVVVSILCGPGWWDLVLGAVMLGILALCVVDARWFRTLRDVRRVYRARR